MKKIIALLLAVLMIASLAACKTQDTTTSTGSASNGSNTNDNNTNDNNQTTGNNSGSTQTVNLILWGAEEDQVMLKDMATAFSAYYADYATITVEVGVCSESEAKDIILKDPEAAADVVTIADDQLLGLVQAQAVMPVQDIEAYGLTIEDVKTRNVDSSVTAATIDGTLYAFPMTADNGYFMFYNSDYFTEDDVKTFDRMLEVADAAGKTIGMELTSGWYLYSFFDGAGYNLILNDDGVSNSCNWNEGGADVCQAILDIVAHDSFKNLPSADFVTGVKEGTVIAGVSGTWNANVAAESWGDSYAACKLPTYTLNGQQVQMSSFSGYKLVVVNPHSANAGWAQLLANWITNEENQITRFTVRGAGPSNIAASESDTVNEGGAGSALKALAEQAPYANPQLVADPYWAATETLGNILANGNPDGTDLQTLIDNAVAGITAK